MDTDNIYTSLEEAKAEIKKRWNDPILKKKVETFLSGNIPEIVKKEPRFLIVHSLTSPDMEFNRFIDMSIKIGIKPLCYEYLDDIFVTTNPNKASLVKMRIFDRFDNKIGEPVFKFKKIIDLHSGMPKEENKKIRSIKTIWGENLVDFHHRILQTRFPDIEIFDASEIFGSMGKTAKEYYVKYLSLFIRNGILFENFIEEGREGEFLKNIVTPAFKKVVEYFGVKPLIIEGVPKNESNDKIWRSYPKYIEEFFKTNDV